MFVVHDVFYVTLRSWFAGYKTDSQAAEKLQSQKPGTFLIRFNTTSPGFLLTRKSHRDVVNFPIEVSRRMLLPTVQTIIPALISIVTLSHEQNTMV